MGRKTPISSNLQKYVEKHFNGPKTKSKNKVSYNTDHLVPDFIDFFGDD